MKLAMCADIHDNDAYLAIFLEWCINKKIDAILCCGDVTSAETLKQMNRGGLPVYLIKGNGELFEDSAVASLPNIHLLGRTGEVVLGNKKIGLCHEPRFIERLLPKKYDIIFHGHTHKPWIETRQGTPIVNPGTLGGVFTLSTFAFWDTDKPLPELVGTTTL